LAGAGRRQGRESNHNQRLNSTAHRVRRHEINTGEPDAIRVTEEDRLGAQQRALCRRKWLCLPHESPRAERYSNLPTPVCLDRASVDARRLSPSRDLARTAFEVAEILAHLVEREPQSENAFQGVYWQTLRQPLAAD
jgi:hypothetical protein